MSHATDAATATQAATGIGRQRPFRRAGSLTLAITLCATAAAARADDRSPSQASRRAPGQAEPAAEGSGTVELINEHIRQAWEDNEVRPSPVADDAEWLRRVYLDLIGHIPSADEVDEFLKDRNRSKRAKRLERLLEHPHYVRNWTTIWTNLAIGRQTQQGVSRPAMQEFFRTAFSDNRPWNEVVYDLVAAEGTVEETPAVNFLLSQMTMRDEGVQATAKTARLLLGVQVQCMQCHNHPHPQHGGQQDEFWQLNSFFRQARRGPRGRDEGDGVSELVLQEFSGPVFFEKRNGEMKVAYPIFAGTEIDPGPKVDRRRELAKLITTGDKPLIARAIVNRMWGHFFGYGFTRPVDDMGPHNPPSHPELLDRLTDEFIGHGYDLKQLIHWICSSEAYHLTSQFGRRNEIDDPSTGAIPLFSHMYVKSMEAEQLFDSLLVATEADKAGRGGWDAAEKQREDWLEQFVIAFETDENDETTTFNGTIPQALMMMNGPLVEKAISAEEGSHLRRVLSGPGSDAVKVQRLFASTLSRRATRRELNAASQLISRNSDRLVAFQDIFWALLNSNEFIMNH